MPIRPFLALFAALLVLAPVAAAAQGVQPGPAISVPALDDAGIDAWIAKSNASVGLLNASLRAKESFNRYASWVDLKKGPTGRERIIYGLYSVSDSQAADAIAKARKAIPQAPEIPELDRAMAALADAFEAAVPVINEADAYYERQDYKSDKAAGARELHSRLMPAFQTLLATRDALEMRQREVKRGLDEQVLARIERQEGKGYAWHKKNVLILAEVAIDLMPRDPRKANLKGFSDAVEAYAAAVKAFDAAAVAEKKSNSFDRMPRELVGKLREIREKASAKRVDLTFYGVDADFVISAYNSMLNFARF